MARVKQLNKPPPKRGTLSILGWDQLMRRTLAAAEARGDKRQEGLRKALREGKSEKLLRKLGIICEADIQREFPNPET